MEARINVDLRSNVGKVRPRLPGAYRFIPLSFYGMILACLGLLVFFGMQYASANKASADATAKISEAEAKQEALRKDIKAAKARFLRAEHIRDWRAGSATVYPLLVESMSLVSDPVVLSHFQFLSEEGRYKQVRFEFGLLGTANEISKQYQNISNHLTRFYQLRRLEPRPLTGGKLYIVHMGAIVGSTNTSSTTNPSQK